MSNAPWFLKRFVSGVYSPSPGLSQTNESYHAACRACQKIRLNGVEDPRDGTLIVRMYRLSFCEGLFQAFVVLVGYFDLPHFRAFAFDSAVAIRTTGHEEASFFGEVNEFFG